MTSDFRREFESALRSGAQHDNLLELVRAQKASGGTQREIYETLQSIWLEHGFDDHDGSESAVKDELEYVMERVWYGGGIWEDGLSLE